jgi:hypothetical protein
MGSNKYLRVVLVAVMSMCMAVGHGAGAEDDVIRHAINLYLHQSIRTPLDSNMPIDYSLTTLASYNDNISIYYQQDRYNGITRAEHNLDIQQRIYDKIYLAGKSYKSPKSELWSINAKWVFGSGKGWKTGVGIANVWEPMYSTKLLLEESKTTNIDFFITPLSITLAIRAMADMRQIYHEERISAKVDISLPTTWKLNKYIKLNLAMFIISKDFGYYRWQQMLMLGIDIIQ